MDVGTHEFLWSGTVPGYLIAVAVFVGGIVLGVVLGKRVEGSAGGE